MFDKLRAGIGSFIDKVLKAELKGETLDKLLEELKLDLLESDVAYTVAEDIAQKLRERVIGVKTARFADKRTLLKGLVAKVLSEILQGSGDEAFFKVAESKRAAKEPLVVLFVGVNGTGKCVAPDSLIQLSEGTMVTAEELYDMAKAAGKEVALPDGYAVLGPLPGLTVYSYNPFSLELTPTCPTAFYKLCPSGPLYTVEMSNARSICVTAEHPFFSVINGRIVQVKAADLKVGSKVLVTKRWSRRCQLNRLGLSSARVVRISSVYERGPVYDLAVPLFHNFVAEGVLVHNTTTIAKLARMLNLKEYSVVLACSDTYRAGAIEQLEEHARKLGIRTIKHQYGADAAAVAYDAINHARAHGINVVLIDTAGRMQTKKNLLEEMKKIIRVTNPDFVILTVDALTGNDAVEQGRMFSEAFRIDGIVISKLDADVKGGAAISVAKVTGKPIFFAGVGQAYEDLIPFKASDIIGRIIG